MPRGDIDSRASYVDKTARLIPAEALTLFLTISGQIGATDVDDEVQRMITFWAATIVCLLLVPLVLYKIQRVRSGVHYAISMFAFALWVFNAQYDRLPSVPWMPYDSINQAVGSVVLLVFTFAAPFLLPEVNDEAAHDPAAPDGAERGVG